MKSDTRNIIIAVIFASFLIAAAFLWPALPHQASAQLQGPPADEGLVQCGRLGSGSSANFCDLCDFFSLVKRVLDWIWNPVAVTIAAAMMIYGGFLMIIPSLGAGSVGMYEKGKKTLWNVVIGFVIVFFSWIIIDTIIKVVVGAPNQIASTEPGGIFPGQSFGPWNAIQCKRAPERAALALLEIPEELRCPKGVKSKIVGTLDVCDSVVIQAFRTDSSVKGAARGQCSASNISTLNKKYGSMIDDVIKDKDDAKLMRAIILVESSGSPGAVSPKGACGIAQVLPTTAKKTCQELLDPRTGITAGYQVVRTLKIEGNVRRVLIGYNGGNRALEPSKECGVGFVKGECTIKPGGYSETINYFQKVEECLGKL